jgi:cobalt/nickel transport system permease protein
MSVFAAMAGVHFLIGVGEALIAAATVGAVAATRPELIAGVEDLDLLDKEKKPLRAGAWGFAAAGLAVAALLVLVVAPLASDEPDGLERVAIDQGFIDSAEDHALAESPLADYGASEIEDQATGVLITFGVGAAIVGVFVVIRRKSATPV